MTRMPELSGVNMESHMERPEPETLAEDGLPLSDIDPATGWMYGEVGA